MNRDNAKPKKKNGLIARLFTRTTSLYTNDSDSNRSTVPKMHIDNTRDRNPMYKAVSRFYRDPEYAKKVEVYLNANIVRNMCSVEMDRKYFNKLFDEIMKLVELKKDLDKKNQECKKLEKELEQERLNVLAEKKTNEEMGEKNNNEAAHWREELSKHQNKIADLVKQINEMDKAKK